MSVGYLDPLGRAWERGKVMLFRPFRLEFWLVLGFAAFLSNLLAGSPNFSWNQGLPKESAGGLAKDIQAFLHEPWTLWILGGALLLLMVLGVVLTWVGARGQFIFLDDVLHARAQIVAPWKRFVRIGDSLFALLIVVSLGTFSIFVILFASPVRELFQAIWQDGELPDFDIWSLAIRALIAVPLTLASVAFQVLTRHFVAPIMWKHDLGAIAAWARFWSLLATRPWPFVGYLLFLILLGVVLLVGILVVGFCTCCIGFLLMAIPYLGSVFLLPVHVPWRALGPEFLSQFGPDWDVRPPAPVPGSPQT